MVRFHENPMFSNFNENTNDNFHWCKFIHTLFPEIFINGFDTSHRKYKTARYQINNKFSNVGNVPMLQPKPIPALSVKYLCFDKINFQENLDVHSAHLQRRHMHSSAVWYGIWSHLIAESKIIKISAWATSVATSVDVWYASRFFVPVQLDTSWRPIQGNSGPNVKTCTPRQMRGKITPSDSESHGV